MSSQQINPAELDTTLAAEFSAPSRAASIPPELFENILTYVGDEERLKDGDIFDTTSPKYVSAIAARRDEMKHLSACTLTCVYWARLTRQHLFQRLILRSSKDMFGLLSLLRAPQSQSPRISPICDILQYLHLFYTLGDHPWFHNLADLQSRYQTSHLEQVILYITGPATPVFVAASTRGSVLHPLFFAVPRVLPIMFPKSSNLHLFMKNIHLPNPTMLFNLLQDCLSLRPLHISCSNLTWDRDPVLQATPSSIGLKYACRTADGYFSNVSGCTDDVLVAAMLESVLHHELFQPEQRQGTYLSPLETSYLFDAMRASTWCGLSPEVRQTKEFCIGRYSNSGLIQAIVAMRLPAGTDFCLQWRLDHFVFRCMASRLPHPPANSNNIRIITHITIDLRYFNHHYILRRDMKKLNIDWDTFLHTVRQFPHLRQIAIQCADNLVRSLRQTLVEFLTHLGEAWFGLGELLGVDYKESWESEWVQLRLDTLMDEIEQTREEIKAEDDAEKGASSELESNVIEREPATASADVQAQTSSAAASQDSCETSQLADGEVEILPQRVALLDEARQCQIEETELETDTNKAALSELDPSVVVEEGSTHDE